VEIQVLKRRISPAQKARREHIIACTRHLITRYGTGVSMEMVASESGTSRSTLYRNFTSREHLISEVTLAAGNELIGILSGHAMRGRSVGENVTWLCEQIVVMSESNSTFLQVCIGNLSAVDPAVIDAQAEIEGLISGLLGVALGSTECAGRRNIEQTIFRYLLGCFILATSGKLTFGDISRDLIDLCRLLLAGIWEAPYVP
jgi:TetR/AcrR family transcriptional regulator, cholesterol catabolism regulator